MDYFRPFYIPAGTGQGAAIQLRGPTALINGELELNVISGGPVFLWRGRLETAAAYGITHGATDPDFDCAASAAGSGHCQVEGGLELITLHSDVESIGYIGVAIRQDHAMIEKLEQLLSELRKGFSIMHDTHVSAIPLGETHAGKLVIGR